MRMQSNYVGSHLTELETNVELVVVENRKFACFTAKVSCKTQRIWKSQDVQQLIISFLWVLQSKTKCPDPWTAENPTFLSAAVFRRIVWLTMDQDLKSEYEYAVFTVFAVLVGHWFTFFFMVSWTEELMGHPVGQPWHLLRSTWASH